MKIRAVNLWVIIISFRSVFINTDRYDKQSESLARSHKVSLLIELQFWRIQLIRAILISDLWSLRNLIIQNSFQLFEWLALHRKSSQYWFILQITAN